MPTKQRQTLAVGQMWQSNLPSNSGEKVVVRRVDSIEGQVYFEYLPPTRWYPHAGLAFATFCRDFDFVGPERS